MFYSDFLNVCEFPQLVDCLVLKGVNKIRVQPLMLTGRAETHVEQIKPKQYQYDQLFNYFEIAKRKYGEIVLNGATLLIILFALDNTCRNYVQT